MFDLTVKRYLLNHWEIVALLLLLSLVVFAIYNLFDHLFYKPRRERENRRLQALQDEINRKQSADLLNRENERKQELMALLEKLFKNSEIHDVHFELIKQNWSNWDADKITTQIRSAVNNLQMEKRDAILRESFSKRLKEQLSEDKISDSVYNELITRVQLDSIETLEKDLYNEVSKHLRKKDLIKKYGEIDALKIIDGKYWLGMTEQQLIDSIGQPTLIQKEILKTKEKVIYIYGKKTTGDVFTFVNGSLDALKDR